MDTSIRRRRRSTTFRKAGWLAVAALIGTALFATPGIALGASPGELQIAKTVTTTTDFPGGDFTFSVDCQPGPDSAPGTLAESYSTFITFAPGDSTGSVHFSVSGTLVCEVTETSTPAAGSGFVWLAPIISAPVTIVAGQTVTVTVLDQRVTTCDGPCESTPPSTPPSAPPSSPVSPPCTAANNCFFTSPSPSPTPTPTPIPTPTPTPSATPIPSPTSTVEAATSTPSPTSEVQGATSKPRVTPPPTATLGDAPGQPSRDTWRIAILGLAGLLAMVLLLTPGFPARARRRQ